MRYFSNIIIVIITVSVICMPVRSVKAQTQLLPALDYANELYYYDTAGNAALKLETGIFIPNGSSGNVIGRDYSLYLENKASPIRISNHQPSFLMKLRNPDVDPTNYIGFSTLKSFKKDRFLIWAKDKIMSGSSYNPSNEIKSWMIKKVAPDVVMLTPSAPLPPGEYSFYFFIGIMPKQAFAFGID